VAMPDETRGELVAAFVILHEGRQNMEDEMIHALDGHIAHFKIPPKVLFVENFPRNPAGKILKRELKKLV
jgi:acyl-coenzyme A synthetase/AMP-(fatty) acid ligase